MPAQPEQLNQQHNPIEWGSNLANVRLGYLGVYNEYLVLSAERPDGTLAEFGEMTDRGHDGSRAQFELSEEAYNLAPGRAAIYQAVRGVMELEKMIEPELSHVAVKPAPVGDWEPETSEQHVAAKGLSETLAGVALKRSVKAKMELIEAAGGVETLNETLAEDRDIAVGLQGEGSNWSIVRLAGFEYVTYEDPETDESATGIRAIVEDRRGNRGLRPENARIERAFIKRS